MDTNNNIQKAKNVPPFVRYCSAIIPTMFDDSLSYYEALCALNNFLQTNVIDTINNNATVTEEYIRLTNELKEYVENYFENLDVQEEINNKLDEMAEDGTLTTIISSYILPVFNDYKDEVDSEISGIRTQLSAIESGSPIPVASTSDMTDHSKVYVNTTDGKWYYYDTTTSTWTAGGTYQSTGIGNGTVSASSLYDGTLIPKYDYVQNYYIDINNGELKYSQYYEYLEEYIPVSTGDYLEMTNIRSNWVALYDSNKDFIIGYGASSDVHDYAGTVNTPNVAYVRFSFVKGTGDHICKINGVEVLHKVNVDWLSIKPSNMDFEPEGLDGSVLIDETVTHDKILLSNGEKLVRGSFWSNYVPAPYIDNRYDGWSRFRNLINVKVGDVIEGKNVRSTWAVFFDENGDAIGNVGGTSPIGNYNFTVDSSTYKIGFNIADNVIDNAEIYINGKKIYFDNLKRYEVDWLELNDEQKASISNYSLGRFKTYRTLFIGDSITEKNFRASKNWVDYLTEDLEMYNYTNAGMSGTGILRTFGSNPNWLTALPTYADNYDLILIMGDMNDWSHGTEFNENNIGQYGDSTTNTFYGAMKVYLEAILAKYPLAKIGWITSTPRNHLVDGSETDYLHGKSSVFEQANSVIKEMCNNYSIPVLELYEESNLYPWIAANNEYYFKPDEGKYVADGVHPNSKGQQIMEYKIKDFVIRNF